MRFYSIVITDPETGELIRPAVFASLKLPATYTSFVNNQSIPGALNVEFDIPVATFAAPAGNAFVRVWGISVQEIGQASDLNGMDIKVYAGMKKGLPLANPSQSGLILQGQIFQALGNWIGTDMTLDLVVTAPTGSPANPKNITFNWKKGTTLASAIESTLATAFPDFKRTIQISDDLVLSADEPFYYQSMAQFAQYVKAVSQNIKGGDYSGVDIRLTQNSFYVYDGSTQTTPVQIAFQDMIGQPTWIAPTKIQIKCVMRADLGVGDYIKLPQAQVTSSPQTISPRVNQKSTFQGTFLISQLYHFGNFRQADPASWVTVIDAAATSPESA